MRLPLCLVTVLAASSLSAQPVILDPSFGTAGVVEIGAGTSSGAYAVVARSAGGFLIGGGVDGKASLVGLDLAGGLVGTFGDSGISSVNLDPDVEHLVLDAVELPGGGVVVAGVTAEGHGFLARTDANGGLDPTFGSGGVTKIGEESQLSAIELVSVIQSPDGRFFAVGSALSANQRIVTIVARFDSDGHLDTTFGTGGISRIALRASISDALLAADGSIYVSGAEYVEDATTVYTGTALVARVTPTGGLDATFGSSGVVRPDLGGAIDSFGQMALDSQGRLVVAGNVMDMPRDTSRAVVARFLAGGALDTAFSGDGIASEAFGTSDIGSSVTVREDGRILLVGGSGTPTSYHAFAAQYLPDGTLDTEFGNGGSIVIEPAEPGYVTEAVVDGEDLVLVGYRWVGGDREGLVVYRLTPTSVAAEAGAAPTGLTLQYRGAHPMRRAVRLAVEVDAPTSLLVEVVDLQGRVVDRLHEGPIGGGVHALTSGADLPTGLYLVRAIAGDGRAASLPVTVVR